VTQKPIILRGQASRDIDDAIAFYLSEATSEAATEFIGSVEKAFAHIRRFPESGSPRYGHALNLPGLRAWSLNRFPYLVFYVEHEDQIDLWRLLHAERDIPGWMRTQDLP
jgi:toxin ParE1/3/4